MFANRQDAGRRLGRRLADWTSVRPVVIGLPRGGVPVAAGVATALRAPLDVVVVRKIGCPWQPELAIGAIAEGGVVILEDDAIRELRISPRAVQDGIAREGAELERRVQRFRGDDPALPVSGRPVILVDDGIATGATMRAAIGAIRARGASNVVAAAPVASRSAMQELMADGIAVVTLERPLWFFAIGEFYEDFRQTPDEEVVRLLRGARSATTPGGSTAPQSWSAGSTTSASEKPGVAIRRP